MHYSVEGIVSKFQTIIKILCEINLRQVKYMQLILFCLMLLSSFMFPLNDVMHVLFQDKHIIRTKEKKLLASDFSPGTSPGTSPNTKLGSWFEEYFNRQFHRQKEIQHKHFIDVGSMFAVTFDYEANFWFNWHKFLLFLPPEDVDAVV